MRNQIELTVDGKPLTAKSVEVTFGPHYQARFIQKSTTEARFELVATHHGFGADASQVDGELEKAILLIASKMKALAID